MNAVKKMLVDISSFFEDLSSSCNPDLVSPSICFSCRHYPNISISQEDDLIINLENENHMDIATYVETKLGPAFRNAQEAERVISEICKGALGIFQWTVL